jgi:YD repeat-containing protein
MKKTLIFLTLLSAISGAALAQAPTYDPRMDLPKVTPPSPNAATLGKYGDIPVGQYAGIPNVSIPLYTVSVGDFSMPISVSYHSQGLKVEEKSGSIGLNWALNAGGVITRSIKGLADENGLGYWTHATWTDSYIASSYTMTESFCSGVYDAQPDMFYYNFAGNSGKFVIDATVGHAAHIMPAQPSLKIKVMDNTLSSIQITDDKGIKYVFDAKETTTDDNVPPTILNYTSAWYLSKIITPAGNITLTYADDNTYFSQYYESDHTNEGPSIDAQTFNPGWKSATSYITVASKVLTKITTPFETITFYTLKDRKDMPSARRITEFVVKDNNAVIKKVALNQSYFGNSTTTTPEDCRLKLDQVVEYSADSTSSRRYVFAYNSPASVPSVKSLSQDFWGYYNGQANVSLLPYLDPVRYGAYIANQAAAHYGNRDPDANYAIIGCLSQITYPTGGTTQFTYESNDYSNVNGVPLNDQLQTQKQAQATATRSSSVNIPSKTTTFTINAAQGVTITTQGSYSGAPPVEDGPSVKVNLINANGSRTNVYSRTMINSTLTAIPSLSVGNYEVVSTVDNLTQTATGTVKYYSLDGYIHVKQGGGIRIKKIVSADPTTLSGTQKTFSYKSAADTTLSSGVLVTPITLTSEKINNTAGYSWLVRSSGPANYLGTTQGNYIGYGQVTEKEGDGTGGRKESYYTTAANYPNTYALDSMVYELGVTVSDIESYKSKYLNDYDAYRGYLTKELVYGASNILLKQTDIQYNLTAALTPTSTGYFELNSKAGQVNYMCKMGCAQCNCSETTGCAQCNPYSIVRFYLFDSKIICPWIYKTQVSATEFDQVGLNPNATLTNFYYDNPLHGLVTRTELTNSKGIVLKTVNKYAQDKSQISGLSATASLSIDSMVNKNMVGAVVESEQYTSGVFNSRLRTNYRIWDAPGNIVTPENIQSQTILSTGLDTRVQFGNYDSKGNLLQVSKSSAPIIVYQWGYNQHYPVAEVKNAISSNIFYESFEEGAGNSVINNSKTGHYSLATGTYSKTLTGLSAGSYILTYWSKSGTAWSLVTVPVTISGSSYPISLPAPIDDVRFYPATAQMTTYTYDPQVGVTSETDPKGETSYYEYDSFNRLKNVKDQYGNILQSYDYNYRP